MNQYHSSWKTVFLIKQNYKIKIMLTSLIVVLDLSSFGHIDTFTIQFESHDKSLLSFFSIPLEFSRALKFQVF